MTSRIQDLTIAARLYLLQCEPKRRKLRDRSMVTPRLLRAGVLADLALAGLIRDDGGRIVPTGTPGRPDKVSQFTLDRITNSRMPTWKQSVSRYHGETVELLEQELERQDVITVTRKRLLWVFPVRKVTVIDPDRFDAIREDVRAVALGSDPVSEIDPKRIATAALVASADLRHVISRGESRQAKERTAAILEESGPIGPALKKAIREAQAAMTAVIVAGAVATSSGSS